MIARRGASSTSLAPSGDFIFGLDYSKRELQNRPEPKPRRPSLSSWERVCAIPIREALIGWRGAHFWHFVRHVFDSLMMRGVVEYNPAARAKPPRLVRESSQTPVFEEAEIVAFLDSISLESLKDIR